MIMNNIDFKYISYLKNILEEGITKTDRTGTGTISTFSREINFDMSEGFPLLTTKKMFSKGIIHELLWFLRGETNIKYLVENKVNIWNGDAYKKYKNDGGELEMKDFIEMIKRDESFAKIHGELGPIYGAQWRNFNGFDQIKNLLETIKTNPDDRRLLVSAWNPSELHKMTLPPCHYGFQVYCREIQKDEPEYGSDKTHKMSLKWTQRSVDSFLGLPFNIASYGLLLHLLCKETNMIPDRLIFSGGDCHIYNNHINEVKEQISRVGHNLPSIEIEDKSIFDMTIDDIRIINYVSDAEIKGKLSN